MVVLVYYKKSTLNTHVIAHRLLDKQRAENHDREFCYRYGERIDCAFGYPDKLYAQWSGVAGEGVKALIFLDTRTLLKVLTFEENYVQTVEPEKLDFFRTACI